MGFRYRVDPKVPNSTKDEEEKCLCTCIPLLARIINSRQNHHKYIETLNACKPPILNLNDFIERRYQRLSKPETEY